MFQSLKTEGASTLGLAFPKKDCYKMKVKKQKRHRRAVRFYTACFGFREPFKVLCDGTFVNHLLVNRIMPADTAVATTLGAQVKLFTTRCVLAELKRLGLSDSLDAARNLLTARCDHEKLKSAVACITEVIGENNPEHFFVATQDAELRSKLKEVPGVPLIYALRNALFLEQPSVSQHLFAKAAEDERSHMSELELKLLNMKKKRRETTDEAPDSSDANGSNAENTLEPEAKKKRVFVKDKVQFKRKKAKGPNPLSCKRKKTHVSTNGAPEKGRTNVDNSSDRSKSRNRKRKRSRKRNRVAEPTV